MSGDPKPEPSPNFLNDAGHGGFEIDWNRNVTGGPACDARGVVMVSGQPLGKLKTSNTLLVGVSLDDFGFLEDRQRAIERRDGDLAADAGDEFGSRQGPGRAGQGFDDQLTRRSESHLVFGEAILGGDYGFGALTHFRTNASVECE